MKKYKAPKSKVVILGMSVNMLNDSNNGSGYADGTVTIGAPTKSYDANSRDDAWEELDEMFSF